MSLITYNELVEFVDEGIITGVPRENINGASIDLTLGDVFWLEARKASGEPIDLGRKETPEMTKMSGEIVVGPGQFCLASTREVFNLPDDIAGYFVLKSSLARAGLNHLHAGWADPTWNASTLTLEYKNVLEFHSLKLTPGMKCGQIVLWRGESVPEEVSYAKVGQYNGDLEAQPSKGVR